MTIGNNILNLLYERNISQKQMAIDLGLAASTLNGYINNRRQPDYDTLLRFSRYFHVSCDYLLGNTPENYEEAEIYPKGIYSASDKQEIRLLNHFRALNSQQQELILMEMRFMNKQNACSRSK